MQTCLGYDSSTGTIQRVPCPRSVQEWSTGQAGSAQPEYRKKLDFSDNAQTVFTTLIIAAAITLILVTLIKAFSKWALVAEEKEAKQAEMDHEEVMKYGYDRTCASCGRADDGGHAITPGTIAPERK